jgi:N-acetylneuraminic acid mutarotase
MKSKSYLKPFAALALSLALAACSSTKTVSTPQAAPERPAGELAPMPEAVTSFAAATSDGWLYVLGGHKGERHDYNSAMVSGSSYRLKLSDGRTWEKLPDGPPAQGLPLVAHRGKVYRTGGMAARNAPGAAQDLYSLTDVQRYDPAKGRWEPLPSLPEPRSSHDAVVLGDKLYVGGGWSLSGGTSKAVWPKTLLELDLKNPKAGWREIPQPLQRRALAMAVSGTKIFYIGGMDSDGKPTSAVSVYDTASGTWSDGPELPAGKFKGFACSAINQGGRIYANTFQGDLLRLAVDGRSWEKVGRLQHPRMAHRLVTAGSSQLIALGGEDGESKRPDLELLTPAASTLTASAAETAR